MPGALPCGNCEHEASIHNIIEPAGVYLECLEDDCLCPRFTVEV